MTIVTTHYRGTPARPRAHGYACLRATQGHIHIEATDTAVAVDLSSHEGSTVSLCLTPVEAHALAELLEGSLPGRDSSWTAHPRTHLTEVNAA